MRIFSVCVLILCCIVSVSAKSKEEVYTFSVPEKPWEEQFGNHRAVIRVDKPGDARLRLKWRRPDVDVENRRFLIISAVNGDTVANIHRVNVNREECEIVFGPVEKGMYYFYYLPYPVQPGNGGFWQQYYAPESLPSAGWLSGAKPGKIHDATVVKIESRTNFDSFYPMEVIATVDEESAYKVKYPQKLYIFPADRSQPVKMRRNIPYKWISGSQSQGFSGEACRGEYYAFQVALWTPETSYNGVNYQISDLKSGNSIIPAKSVTCFNIEGVDSFGEPFIKNLTLKKGEVLPLWFGVDIPENQKPGVYSGKIKIKTASGIERESIVKITVSDSVIANRGDNEPWRYSRLRWLNSTLGIDTVPVKGYTPVKVYGDTVSVLNRNIVTGKSSLPSQIIVSGHKLLESPVKFIIDREDGGIVPGLNKTLSATSPDKCIFSAEASAGNMKLSVKAVAEYDGYINYQYAIVAEDTVKLSDVRLEIPFSAEEAKYILGMGLPGQALPSAYEGKWDAPEKSINSFGVSVPVSKEEAWLWPFDSFWIGSAHAGLHCELRGTTYSGPLLNLYRPAYPASWHNSGKGGFRVNSDGSTVKAVVYSGDRTVNKGDTLKFEFSLLVTPVKDIDAKSQFADRYYHNGSFPTPTDEDVAAGVKVINVHHANSLNPFINYPFITTDTLKSFVDRWHGKGCKVKIYYTVRELTSAVTELWALRALGDEILRDGNGGGYPWCREHLVDGYVPQWYDHFGKPVGDIAADAALLSAEGESRWYNYYIEGLAWLVRNVGIDGIYLDDVSFDRHILKRMCRAMESVKPGCIIDLHSNTGFSRGPAAQYAEFFPYVDKLWFGESFLYDKMTPENYLVESSGIPFGLMSDMLHAGGNRWLGMQYGMTVRHPWLTEGVVCDPRVVWHEWDRFGIADVQMIGFWEEDVPVKTDNENVKVTVYKRDGKALLSVGNYTDAVQSVKLDIDWDKLGISRGAKLTAPEMDGFQPAKMWSPDDFIEVAPRGGWLIYLQ